MAALNKRNYAKAPVVCVVFADLLANEGVNHVAAHKTLAASNAKPNPGLDKLRRDAVEDQFNRGVRSP